MRVWVRSLASLSGLKILHCHELWYRLQTYLGSRVAVAVVRSLAWELCILQAQPKKKDIKIKTKD